MSPHQLGIQEMLLLSEIRGRCPDQVTLFGVVPKSYEAGIELSPELAVRLPELAGMLQAELQAEGIKMEARC
jgi:hydrogenase maturation protease